MPAPPPAYRQLGDEIRKLLRSGSWQPGDRFLTERDVAAVFEGRRKTPAVANRWLATLGACFNAARRRRLIPFSPCEGIEFYAENAPRARTYTDEELGRLWVAIATEPDVYVGAALRLQLETGCRIGETLKAKWEDIDLVGATWRLPSPKAGKPQMIFLHERTVAWLKKLPVAGPYLIPGRDPKKPRTDFKRAWRRVRESAKLPADCRTHDIRRTFGREMARESGLHLASRALRHADVRTTARIYAPLDVIEIRAAVTKALPGLAGTPEVKS